MKKIILSICIVLSLLVVPVMASAFTFIIHNTADEKMLYRVEWLDCPYQPMAVNIMGGEIEKGVKRPIEIDYTPGIYHAAWKTGDYKMMFECIFRVEEGTGEVILTPEQAVRIKGLKGEGI